MGNNCQGTSLTVTPNKTVPAEQNQSQGTQVVMRNGNEEGLTNAKSQDGTEQVVVVFQPTIKAGSPSNSDKKQPGTCNTQISKSKMNLTLQQYRKEIGLKIQIEKRQKLGISCKLGAPQDREAVPKVNSGIPCPHCGAANDPSNVKCKRCTRAFEKPRAESPSSQPSSIDSFNNSSTCQSKDFYGTRRPRTNQQQSARQTRQKPEEPQCVTLSSDEEDNPSETPSPKKFKECNITDGPQLLSCSQPLGSSLDTSNDKMETSASQDGLSSASEWANEEWPEPYFWVNCRSARVGSYRFLPNKRVLFCAKGIRFNAPVIGQDGRPYNDEMVTVSIQTYQLLQMEVHFSRTMPVIFIYTTPSLSRSISSTLGLKRESGPFFDALSINECEKRLTLLPNDLDDASKHAIRQAFVPRGIFREIAYVEANRILMKSSPPEVRECLKQTQRESFTSSTPERPKSPVGTPTPPGKPDDTKRMTRSKQKAVARTLEKVECMFQWSEGMDKFSISTDDYLCLNQDNLLNDSIIDFYLRYIFSTQLDEELRKKCYVFSSFFYQRLTTRPLKQAGRKHPIEDDPNLTMAEKRHARVKSWTKKVDLFEKDYLIIPINERSHWFLAVVCFPGLAEPVSTKDNTPIVLPAISKPAPKTPKTKKKILKLGSESFCIGNTTITPIGSASKKEAPVPLIIASDTERDEADSEEDDFETQVQTRNVDEVPQDIKQSCILFFDSLSGGGHRRVAATLRDYLMIEYRVKKCGNASDKESSIDTMKSEEALVKTLFSKEKVAYACVEVPQQTNSFDCGVFVLQYAESFMKKPFTDYYLPRLDLRKWFPSLIIKQKRKEIQNLLVSLTRELNPAAAEVLKLLGVEEKEMNVSDVDNRNENPPSHEGTDAQCSTNENISQTAESNVNDMKNTEDSEMLTC